MRISDWSSDVCSSDLISPPQARRSVLPRTDLRDAHAGRRGRAQAHLVALTALGVSNSRPANPTLPPPPSGGEDRRTGPPYAVRNGVPDERRRHHARRTRADRKSTRLNYSH